MSENEVGCVVMVVGLLSCLLTFVWCLVLPVIGLLYVVGYLT